MIVVTVGESGSGSVVPRWSSLVTLRYVWLAVAALVPGVLARLRTGVPDSWGDLQAGTQLLMGNDEHTAALLTFAVRPELHAGPAGLVLLSPLTVLPATVGATVCTLVVAGLLPLCCHLVETAARERWGDRPGLAVTTLFGGLAAAVAWAPLTAGLQRLDDVVVVLCLTLAVVLVGRGRGASAAVVLGAGVGVAPWAVLLVPAVLVAADRRRWWWTGLGVLVGALLWSPFVATAPRMLSALWQARSGETALFVGQLTGTDGQDLVWQLGAAQVVVAAAAGALAVFRGRTWLAPFLVASAAVGFTGASPAPVAVTALLADTARTHRRGPWLTLAVLLCTLPTLVAPDRPVVAAVGVLPFLLGLAWLGARREPGADPVPRVTAPPSVAPVTASGLPRWVDVLVRHRYAALSALSLLIVAYSSTRELTGIDYSFFAQAARILTGQDDQVRPLELYALQPIIQIGPLPLAFLTPVTLLLPRSAGVLVAGVVLVMLLPLCCWLLERAADNVFGPWRWRPASFLLAGVICSIFWHYTCLTFTHPDDALVVLGVCVALHAISRRSPWVAVVALGLGASCKPWALALLPLAAAASTGRRRWLLPVLAGVVAALPWAPFVLAHPETVDSLSAFRIWVKDDSPLAMMGVHGHLPGWVRPTQVLTGAGLAAVAVWRGRWHLAPYLAISARIALEGQSADYYFASLVVVAAAAGVLGSRRGWPWLAAVITFFIYDLRWLTNDLALVAAFQAVCLPLGVALLLLPRELGVPRLLRTRRALPGSAA